MPRTVTPGEHPSFFQESVRRLQSTYACIIALDDQQRSVAKGTAVFVSLGPAKVLVTAPHVVRADKLIGRKLMLLLSRLASDGLGVVGSSRLFLSLFRSSQM